MKFISTRVGSATGKTPVTFRQAVFSGLPADGGLYVPAEQPDLSARIAGFSEHTSFQELAADVVEQLIGDELSSEAVRRVCERAFTFEPTLRQLEEKLTLLELFHGPTCAFKDFGAAFLASGKGEHRSGDPLPCRPGQRAAGTAADHRGRQCHRPGDPG
jgi:threonine synthase